MDPRLIIARAVDVYSLLMLVWVIASWLPKLRAIWLVRQIGRVCEPPLRWVRRVVPATGGIDFSPMVMLVVLQLVARAILGSY
ncbi:MAG: YggT family protein [Deltaproteobacteria bacterium]|nr:YggT family protein [Deltaproteobacteria bacterium]